MARHEASPARGRLRLIRWSVYTVGSLPALWTYWLAVNDRLGADPVKALEHTLGLWSLRLLVIGLAVRPLQVVGGMNLMPYRRAIGLLAFGYATLHVIVYTWLDQGFDLPAIGRDIVKRPYITVGLLAFLILVPLAVTSNARMIKALGGKAWSALHRWVYAAAALAAVHFIMVLKIWSREALLYAALIAILLLWRVWDHRIGKANRRASRARRPVGGANAGSNATVKAR